MSSSLEHENTGLNYWRGTSRLNDDEALGAARVRAHADAQRSGEVREDRRQGAQLSVLVIEATGSFHSVIR